MRSLKTINGKRLDLSIIHKAIDEVYETKTQILTDKQKVEYFEIIKLLKNYRMFSLILQFIIVLFLGCLFVFWVDLQDSATLVLNYHGNNIYLISQKIDPLNNYDFTLFINIIFWIIFILFELLIRRHIQNTFTVKFVKKINQDPVLKEYTVLNYCSSTVPLNNAVSDWRDAFKY